MPSWDFITNHGAVIILVSQQPKITGREISQKIGITERAVLRIVAVGDLLDVMKTSSFKVGTEQVVNES